jgi:hypothetical protein
MERTMERAAVGDIPGCMEMQKRANDCLRAHGLPAHDLPESYFKLMHEGISAALAGDQAGAELIGESMNTLIAQLGIEEEAAPEPQIPQECLALERLAEEAEAAGDLAGAIRCVRDYDRCLQRYGLPTLALPDEYYETQALAQEAYARGDTAEFARLQAETERILSAAGVPTDIKLVQE